MELHLPDHVDVVVVLGSKSDQAVAEQIKEVFDDFQFTQDDHVCSAHRITVSYHVCSAHRDHERLAALVPEAEARGAKVFIGVAGMAAHLPGVLAALTVRPVIGVPVEGKLDGMDALLSIAQMPPGIPVATVALGGGMNAALLAVEILAVGDAKLHGKLTEYRQNMRAKNRGDDAALREALGI